MFNRCKKIVCFFVVEKNKYYGTYVLLRPENYFTDVHSVHHKKKQQSLKCAINDALIGINDKVPTLIGVCKEVRISL